jgi:hypothetical protein
MTLQRSPRVLVTLGLLTALLTLAMLAPVSSSANHLIVEDLESSGDGLIVRDPSTGLEWLKVTATLGLSINDVLAHPLITSGAFRYARESEVQALIAGAGLPLPGVPPFSLQSAQCASAACQSGAREIIEKFGTTNTQTPVGTLGYLDPDITAFNNYRVVLSSTGEVATVARFTDSPTTRRTGAFGSGSWLVRADADAGNQPPVADAGPDQTGHPGIAVSLDGTSSFDPDGDTPLTFAWSIVEAPEGSLAELDDPTIAMPTFTPDLLGDYRIQLVVTDALGLASAPDEVVISTANSAPVADAGADQQVVQLGTVVLDGSQSHDPDGDDITYAWSLVQRPAGSLASLSDTAVVNPTFVADVQGEYRASLTVTDEFGAASAPAEVVVSFLNIAPVARAGDTQVVVVGATVQLDGSGSSDANLDPLTYQWSVTSQPAGSYAALSDATAPAPTFVPDLAGTYTVSLVVNDGQVDSEPDVVTIQATSDTDAIVARVITGITAINGLAPGDFKNANMKKALTNKLAAVIADVEAGKFQHALDKLEYDVLAKTDGCDTSGAPDRNDWIRNCGAQEQVFPVLREAADALRVLLP